jgi:uncharacterized protein
MNMKGEFAPLSFFFNTCTMQLSGYLKSYPLPERPGQWLLYSTRKASMAIVPEQTFLHLRENRTEQVPGQIISTLTDLDMLVSDPEQEKRDVLNMLPEINEANTILRISVVPGLACNFACPYCYEGKMKANRTMSDKVVEQLIAFVRQRFMPETTKLNLDFYGGEPLLYTGIIKQLASELRPFAEKQGAEFRFALVSNGSLLTPEIAEDLKKYGLYGVKVTVDGPARHHNRSRPFKSGKESFGIILENIEACCEITEININGNFTQDNYRDFPELLDHLRERGLGPEKIPNITFHPAMSIDDAVVGQEFTSGCATSSEPWLAEASLFLRDSLLQRGYKVPKMTPSPCMVDIEQAVMVNYDGTIYKCPGLIGHDEFAVGDIFSGIKDYSQSHHLDNWRIAPECQDCTYLPLCFGGCRFMQYQRTGSMAGVDCQKDFLDRTLHTLLLQQIRYPTKSKE